MTWAMEGSSTLTGKVFAVFADMDAMIGKDLDEGLSDLERVAQSGAPS